MNKKKIVLLVLVVLTIAFIFGQSFLNQDTSIKESDAVKTQIIKPIHKVLTGNETTKLHVRDVAHVVEFVVLGLVLVMLLKEKKLFRRWLKTVSYCGFAGLLDESIQYLSDRTPQVDDVWRDILGAVIGAVIGIIVVLIVRNAKERKQEEEKSS